MRLRHRVVQKLVLSVVLALTLHFSFGQLTTNPPPDYYDTSMKRMLAIAAGSYIYGVSQGQLDLDSAMLLGCRIYGLNRLLPYNEGYVENSTGNKLIDEGKIESAKKLLSKLDDGDKLQLLAELGSYYLFKPGTVQQDLDSAHYFIQQLNTLSSPTAMGKWHLESLSLLGKWHFQKREIEQSQEYLSAVTQAHRQAGDEILLVNTLLQQALHLPSNASSKLIFLQEALALCQKHELKIKEVQVLSAMVSEHFKTDWNLAEKELFQILELEKSIGSRHLQYTNDVLAYIYTSRSEYLKGMHHADESIRAMEATGDRALSSLFYRRKSEICAALERMEEAIAWNTKALDAPKSKETQIFWYKSFFEKAGWLYETRPTEAFDLIREVEAEYPPLNLFDEMHLAFLKGVTYVHLDDNKNAESQFNKFLSLAEKFPPEHVHGEFPQALIQVAYFFFSQGDYVKARQYTEQVASVPGGKKFLITESRVYLMLFKLDSVAGKHFMALKNYQQYKWINDSVVSLSQRKKMDEIMIRFESEKKDQDIQILTQQSELQQARLAQSNVIRNITIGGLAGLLVIVGLLYNQYRAKQKSNTRLQHQQQEISQKNTILQHLVEEKELLMKEIHHRVKNNLHTIVSLLESQSAYLSQDALAAVRDSQHRVYAMSLIHQKLYLSENVTSIDMSVYVKELVNYLSDSFNTGQNIRFQIDIEPFELDVAQAIPLGLILNEAITNSIKYAFPHGDGTIAVSISEGGDHLLLTIKDDGIGLPNNFDNASANSLGMKLMKGLSREIDARFLIESKGGTIIKVTFNSEPMLQQRKVHSSKVNETIGT